jgi:hypothetical protein
VPPLVDMLRLPSFPNGDAVSLGAGALISGAHFHEHKSVLTPSAILFVGDSRRRRIAWTRIQRTHSGSLPRLSAEPAQAPLVLSICGRALRLSEDRVFQIALPHRATHDVTIHD